jgi:NAD(P)-dependent dehydrogenase (short-subunit alcohol dehydrogenase family)
MEIKSVAVVTGASQGIGRATASRLARDFSAVVPVARDKQDLETAASEITALGAQAMVVAIELRLPQSAETVVKDTLDLFGRIDALLDIAGAVPEIDLFQRTYAQWDDGMALKFHAAQIDDAGLGRIEGIEGICGFYVRECGARFQARKRSGRGNQRSHHRTREGIRRTRNQGRSAGQ